MGDKAQCLSTLKKSFRLICYQTPSEVRACIFWFLFTKVVFIQNNALCSRKTKLGVAINFKGLTLGWNVLLRSQAVEELKS